MKKDLVFATGNAHKVLEVNQILENSPYRAVPMSRNGINEDIPETGDTMEENAWQKADYLKNKLGLDCFAEDSGLEIIALDMEPGIYTARYAGPQRNHDDNMDKVLRKLKDESDRRAQFRAVVALSIDGERHSFEGVVKGKISTDKRGEGGFGYDPIFIPNGYESTFAELQDEVKNTISHRARAIEAMTSFLEKRELAIPSIVSTEWLQQNMEQENLIIIDVSSAAVTGETSEFQDRYIPRSFRIDLKSSFSDKSSSLPNTFPTFNAAEESMQDLGINADSIVVVYDNLGVYNSPRFWFLLKALGHENAAVLDGGLPAWIKAGYKTMTKPATPEENGNFIAKKLPKWLKSKKQISDNIERSDFQVIDARSRGRFEGSEPEPRAGLRGGHIPGSVSLPYSDVLKDGSFKSEPERRAIWNSLNIDKAVSFTCGSGMTACIDMLAFYDFVHLPMSIFDGSWTEWALDESLPVEINS